MCRCIIDRKQRKFDAESCRLLCNFAEVVVKEIEKDEARVRQHVLHMDQHIHIQICISCQCLIQCKL